MLDLDNMLRRASREPQPEGPPPGGFAELQRRLHPPAHPGILTGFAGLSALVAVVGITAWWLIVSPERPAEEVPATVLQPTAPPVAANELRGPVVRFESLGAASRAAVYPVASPNHRPAEAAAETGSPTAAAIADSRRAVAAEADRPALPPSHPGAPPPVVTRRIALLTFPPLLPLRRGLDIDPPAVSVPERIEKRSAGQWDLRLNVYPNPARRNNYLNYYTGERPATSSYSSSAFVVDGKLRLLYWAGTVSNTARYLQPIGQVQVARNTRGGLTYGFGTTYYRQGRYPERSILRQLGQETDTYVAYTDVDLRMWLLAANVGYVFRTNSRWKPWVHGGLQMALRSVKRENRQVLGIDAGNTWTQSAATTRTYPAFGKETWVVPNAEVGIQYRLSTHWAAGLSLGAAPGSYADINPTLGAELRFRW